MIQPGGAGGDNQSGRQGAGGILSILSHVQTFIMATDIYFVATGKSHLSRTAIGAAAGRLTRARIPRPKSHLSRKAHCSALWANTNPWGRLVSP